MITFPREVYEQMVAHALEEAPHECVGIVAFYQGAPAVVYRGRNIAKEAHHMYELDPEDQLRIFHRMGEAGFTLGAIYHSHPSTQPIPSQEDLKNAMYAEALCIIIGLEVHPLSDPDVRVWKMHDNTYEPVAHTVSMP